MNLITSTSPPRTRLGCYFTVIRMPQKIATCNFKHSFPLHPCYFLDIPKKPSIVFAKAKSSQARSEPILEPSFVDDVTMNEDDDDPFLEDSEDEQLVDDEGDLEVEYFAEEVESYSGDGAGGGGISLAGTSWDRKAYEIAQEVALSFDGEIGIYAFKTMLNASIQIRIERLTNKSGSPDMMDIEAFSTTYRARLDEAEDAGSIPDNIYFEISSPGVERTVRVPQDLDRFKDRNMYVKYATKVVETGLSSEHDGVFKLVSFDLEANSCTWQLANVRVNREKSGKGRPLNKKQREWRISTPFDSLRLVRLYSET